MGELRGSGQPLEAAVPEHLVFGKVPLSSATIALLSTVTPPLGLAEDEPIPGLCNGDRATRARLAARAQDDGFLTGSMEMEARRRGCEQTEEMGKARGQAARLFVRQGLNEGDGGDIPEA